jgi:hypothetical protein
LNADKIMMKRKSCFLPFCLCVLSAYSPNNASAQTIIEPPSSFQRAGNPQEASPLARLSDSGGFIGYYVGGGAVSRRRGDGPYIGEGTWGWDFQGKFLERQINLLWWHGRRAQGGSGAYKTDGPTLAR